ncbi:UNVERIFIED_CONTAM: hypothetical protein FKN15_035458 [Acipenser sinensis]
MEDEYMIGNALLACPVTDAGVTEVNVLFPGSGEVSLGVQCRRVFVCTSRLRTVTQCVRIPRNLALSVHNIYISTYIYSRVGNKTPIVV